MAIRATRATKAANKTSTHQQSHGYDAIEIVVPAQPGPAPLGHARPDSDKVPLGARLVVVAGYVGAALLSFVPPLAIYVLSRGGRSSFVARHAAQAFNTALTTILYAACSAIIGALLTLDSPHFGLQVAVTGALFFWLVNVGYLASAAHAAARGRRYEIPLCLCAAFAQPG